MTRTVGGAVWTFSLDEDDDWVPSREPSAGENLRRAVETLLLGIASAGAAQTYLAAWRADSQRHGAGFTLGTASAQAERVGPDLVRLVDLHGQFEDCGIAADEFEAMLCDYARAARADEREHG
ncbi:hypothetical protein [Streptomyces hilarionis]|uniref:hypothetical protein n=1 Tax=Streptomyces hilarionis TaxID=2839954 RepID=UPI002119FC96|nr:hypothetical protein [Streptomyces hilarionis]MCQ9132170.1 hypothetical protein [Streptomyces hilarionis]